MTAYLGVGSNIDPETNLMKGLKLLLSRNIRIRSVSTHFRTEPLKHRIQPSYINGVWKVGGFKGDLADLKSVLKSVETECGRVRTEDSYASRTLDLDILLTGDYASEEILSRNFIYIPLLELDGEVSLPGYGKLKTIVDVKRGETLEPLVDFTEALRRIINE